MREITTHKVNGCNSAVNVIVMDEPGSGGAPHHYRIEPITETHPQGAINTAELRFQDGPIAEVGTNGVTHEALLAVVADRLECFQRGPFACQENQAALDAVHMAMGALKIRTERRIARGVEGTHTV